MDKLSAWGIQEGQVYRNRRTGREVVLVEGHDPSKLVVYYEKKDRNRRNRVLHFTDFFNRYDSTGRSVSLLDKSKGLDGSLQITNPPESALVLTGNSNGRAKVVCSNCKQSLNGFHRIFKENQIIDLCPRCGYENGVVLRIASQEEIRKSAGVWDDIKGALVSLAPAVAVTGAWELLTAYETFKKVFQNILMVQQPTSHLPGYFANRKSVTEGKNRFSFIEGWENKLIPYDFRRIDSLTDLPGLCAVLVKVNGELKPRKWWYGYSYGGGKINDSRVKKMEFTTPRDQATVGLGGPLRLRAILRGLLPVSTWEAFKAMPHDAVANLSKKSYLEREPSTGVSSTGTDLEPYFITDFNILLEFIKDITPIVAKHALDTKDDSMLKSLSLIVNTMREFRKSIHTTNNNYPENYDRTPESHDYTKKPQFAQEEVSGA
jgi:hypothetical protein